MIASKKVIPKVKGTNKKWYIAVAANCNLESSTTSIRIAPPYGTVGLGLKLQSVAKTHTSE
jgi:hypothetical protein